MKGSLTLPVPHLPRIRFSPPLRRATVAVTLFATFRDPMPYTLGQASKATALHKTRLSRAIKNGVISATKTQHGGYLIDPAELHRVFPPVTTRQSQDPVSDSHMGEGVTPPLLRLKEVETRLEEPQHRLSDKEDVIRTNLFPEGQRLAQIIATFLRTY
jgi:hypothetical protein